MRIITNVMVAYFFIYLSIRALYSFFQWHIDLSIGKLNSDFSLTRKKNKKVVPRARGNTRFFLFPFNSFSNVTFLSSSPVSQLPSNPVLCAHEESNLDHGIRNPMFYPLNYERAVNCPDITGIAVTKATPALQKSKLKPQPMTEHFHE